MDFHQYIPNVESMTVRKVAGEGDQMEVLVRTKSVTLVLRLIGRRGKTIRVLDLRRRDGSKQRKSQFVSVPFSELFETT